MVRSGEVGYANRTTASSLIQRPDPSALYRLPRPSSSFSSSSSFLCHARLPLRRRRVISVVGKRGAIRLCYSDQHHALIPEPDHTSLTGTASLPSHHLLSHPSPHTALPPRATQPTQLQPPHLQVSGEPPARVFKAHQSTHLPYLTLM